MNHLNMLSRPDKHYLGGGNRVVWTPTFPVWLERPGFWDFASYYNYRFEPGFTVTLLDENLHPVPLRFEEKDWTPARLRLRYSAAPQMLEVLEERVVLPEDSLVSVFRIRSQKERQLHFLAWSVQRSYPSQGKEFVDNLDLINDRLIFTKFLQIRNLPLYSIHAAFGLSEVPDSYAVYFSQGTAVHPRWELTPFFDRMDSDRLANEIKISGIDQDGLIYFALHRRITVRPGEEKTIWAALNLGASEDEAQEHLQLSLHGGDPVARSETSWREYFESLPQFHCSDPFIERYYWYRWYGLRLFTIQGGGEVNYPHPAVCEGPDYFRVPITFSAQCHMLETRWMPTGELARGCLGNFVHLQNEDGSFTGHIYPNAVQRSGFYHANWGRALLAVHRLHPDRAYLEEVYPALCRYAEYFDTQRDAEETGLYDIVDQYETGQEYMSRYLAVDPDADRYDWVNRIRLKGVDATVYLYELKQALAEIAEALGRKEDSREWQAGAKRIKDAVLQWMWDPEEEMFFDVDPLTMKRTGIKAAVCFYPYFTDIVDERHLPGLKRHLLNSGEFWTPWPVPATSADDPLFSPDAEWKGKRHNCPWNGRVWPMTNSHVAEALFTCARRFGDEELKRAAVDFLRKFIRMMFFESPDGKRDVSRPNCFEHYHPYLGRPSVYRGVDDYQHSWVVDLIIRYVAGIAVHEDGTVSAEPFDFGLEQLELDNLNIAGQQYTLTIAGGKIRLEKHGGA